MTDENKDQLQPAAEKIAAEQKRHQEVLAKHALEQQEVKEVLVFIQKYTKPAAIALAVICAVVLANRFVQSQHLKQEVKADAALAQAQNTDDLKAVVDTFSDTAAGPIALMGLAREKYNAGHIDDADTYYSQFLKQHKNHELAPQAALNYIACKEAKGQYGDAQLLYGAFLQEKQNSFLAPMARLGQARCLEKLEQFVEAKLIYEDLIINYPSSSWAKKAEANLRAVAAKIK